MTTTLDALRLALSQGPVTGLYLQKKLNISQPTLSRLIRDLGREVVRIGAARSIQYTLRDRSTELDEFTVYRIDEQGRLALAGVLTPVRPDAFVMQDSTGNTRHSPGMPWWLLDQRPQGFLGRAFAARHAASLMLDARVDAWSDRQALRAILLHGHDSPGHWVLGHRARDWVLDFDPGEPISQTGKGAAYAQLADQASQGGQPGSSAGGEQPKFTAWALTPEGPRHVLVKFTWADDNPVTQRWRDLLVAEHLALEALCEAGVPAARSWIHDHGSQRFLELERFDRIGARGRRALYSLSALDSEFARQAFEPWPVVMTTLAAQRIVSHTAQSLSQGLHAFGVLIGNNDMHGGNLSLVPSPDDIQPPGPRLPMELAPAYDMLPMAFAPRSSGELPSTLPPAQLHASVEHPHWQSALQAANRWLERLREDQRLSPSFAPCLQALDGHLRQAQARIERLG